MGLRLTESSMKKNGVPEFWAKVEKSEGCWNWIGGYNKGYGRTMHNGKKMYAHTISYLLCNGCLPKEGLELDHLCRNKKCVNPDHLEAVTHRENVVRGNVVNNKKSGYPLGVRKTGLNRYGVDKMFNHKLVFLGTYSTIDEASIVYQTAVCYD